MNHHFQVFPVFGRVTFRGSWAFAGPVGNSARPNLRAYELSIGIHPFFLGKMW
jgi:hypothetical protein